MQIWWRDEYLNDIIMPMIMIRSCYTVQSEFSEIAEARQMIIEFLVLGSHQGQLSQLSSFGQRC